MVCVHLGEGRDSKGWILQVFLLGPRSEDTERNLSTWRASLSRARLRAVEVLALETQAGSRVDEALGKVLMDLEKEKHNGSVTVTIHVAEGRPSSVRLDSSWTAKLKNLETGILERAQA